MSIDAYVTLDTITGEYNGNGQKNAIQALTLKWGGTNQSSMGFGGGAGSGKVSLSDMAFTKPVDSSSPSLFQTMCQGAHLASGTIALVKAGSGGKPYVVFNLRVIFVTGMDFDLSSSTSEVPVETIKLSFGIMSYQYLAQNAQGLLTLKAAVTFDIRTNALS